MRRGSVIGPLILIGIGALFLMYNLWPQIPIGDLLSRYWPFLLIVWGGLRLIEVLFWAAMSKPLPGVPNGFGANIAAQTQQFNNRMEDLRNYGRNRAGWHGPPPQ